MLELKAWATEHRTLETRVCPVPVQREREGCARPHAICMVWDAPIRGEEAHMPVFHIANVPHCAYNTDLP